MFLALSVPIFSKKYHWTQAGDRLGNLVNFQEKNVYGSSMFLRREIDDCLIRLNLRSAIVI